MKKFFALLLVCVLAISLAACGGTGDGGGTSSETVRLNMATGGTGGTYYPLGGAMAVVINNNTAIEMTSMSSGASADNIRQIGRGDADVAIVQNDVMSYAFNGTGTWVDSETINNMGTLMSLYPETVQIIVLANSDIHSVEDLRGKRVSIGDVGSGVEANATQVLAAYGLTRDDIRVENLAFNPSADLMRDMNLDAFFVTAATPNTAVMELSTSRELRLLNLSDGAMTQLQRDYPFYVRVTVTSDDYSFLSEPVQTLAVQATLIASTDTVSEQAGYDIVKALIENAADIGHARGAYINAENAVKSISVDFHPGARLYFQEIGVLD